MTPIIENIKARIYGKPYNIYTEKIEPNNRFSGDFIYNDTLYYGNRFFVFFYSAQNEWFKDKKFNNNI